jgi:hypothetical protein
MGFIQDRLESARDYVVKQEVLVREFESQKSVLDKRIEECVENHKKGIETHDIFKLLSRAAYYHSSEHSEIDGDGKVVIMPNLV